jgi:hypothetical protein
MLSTDEIDGGMTFILTLWDGAGTPTQWVETLRGDLARRWYEIYRNSNWAALRAEAAGVFRRGVTVGEAERVRTARQRCIYIHTHEVRPDQLEPARAETHDENSLA